MRHLSPTSKMELLKELPEPVGEVLGRWGHSLGQGIGEGVDTLAEAIDENTEARRNGWLERLGQRFIR